MNITFKFSNVYDAALKNKSGDFILTWEKAERKITMLEDFWQTYGNKIVTEFGRVTKLSFAAIPIPCYLNSAQSFSDPLTVRVYKKDEYTQDTLVHELCHVIMSQNNVGKTKAWQQLEEDYKDEPAVVRVHIVVHAIHQLVYKNIFPDRLNSIQTFAEALAYVRSWEIVKEVGAQKVVDKYLLGTEL